LREAVETFCAELGTIRQQVCGIPSNPKDRQLGYTAGGIERVAKVLDFVEYQQAMLGSKGWVSESMRQAQKLLLEAVSPDQARQRLDAIRKSQPKQKATWRSV
jgi:hypothetical protein